MLNNRTLKTTIERVSNNFRVILLTGMRQVGKTTLLKMLSEQERTYLTLDDTATLNLAKTDPYLFFKTYQPPMLIDEIQYAPDLFPHIKMLVDNSLLKGQVWLTGSRQFLLMKGVSESLAGRLVILELLGFSIYEREGKGELQKPFLPSFTPAKILQNKSVNETFEVIWKGSFPEISLLGNENWTDFYSSFVKTYIERDVRQLINIGNELSFYNFLKVVAARTGQELNMTDISNSLDISLNTVKSWMSVLQASGVVYLLPPYYENITKRTIKRPKLYFTDAGLAAYLTNWNTPETLQSGAMNGAFFETFVISEIIKSYKHNGLSPNFYFYRDSNKVEIDLLIYENGKFYPIEIKMTANPNTKMVKNFSVLEAMGKTVGYGSLICLTDNVLPLTHNTNAISIWDI
ncbi:MAG: ATP-binding protein [Dysgonamonadaceae bacterium]|jgi:predicted AAA+ superfamily ATPase|nr:ATP-binding protein [Dysgonamonadaceae bacterium]